MLAEPILVVAKIVAALDALEVRHVVGGSLASSMYGVPRATNDVDVAAELREPHIPGFVATLSGEFFVDADMIKDAVRRRASFNVIYLATMFKADVFVLSGDAWSREEIARGRIQTLQSGGDAVAIRFASPEDTILHKLVWYRLGGGVSDRQWSDVLGVFKVQGGRLDQPYLDRWAPELDVRDLLARARREAG